MAIVQKYPISTPKSSDLIIGTSIPDPNTNDDPKTVNFPVSSISTLVAAEVPQGPIGPAGADGANGTDGANGINGTNGTNGADGADGAPGANGADGADGQDGAQGPAGADGTSIEIQGTKPTVADLPATGNTVGDLWIIDQTGGGATAGDGYVWTVGNTWLNIGPLRGPQGIQGTAGTNGTNGTNGTDGAPGATGPAGADGVDGVDGTNGTNGAPGDTGAQGPRGIQGIKGDKGDQGDQGVAGADGADGVVQSVVAGTNVTVDSSDPANPVVSANVPFGLTGSGTIGTLAIWTGSTELGNSFLQKGTNAESIQTSNATASGSSSIALHQNASATNTFSTAIGFGALASNQHSVAIGIGASATGNQSMVFGNASTASGASSMVIAGVGSSATGTHSVSSGLGTEAHDYGETVFGLYNKISTGSQTSRPFSPKNNIFVVGNGTSPSTRTNALELNDDGELTLPFYGDNTRLNKLGLTFEAVTGKIISADSPNYTQGEVISGSSGGSTTLDTDTPGIVFLSWSGADGTFTVNLPDTLQPSVNFNSFYNRKFKFVLSSNFSGGGKDVVLTPFSTQKINGVSSYTIPSAAYNVIEIWNRGGEWIIISKLT